MRSGEEEGTNHASDRGVGASCAADRGERSGGKGKALLDDLPNVVLEPSVEHPVGLIENQPRHLAQIERSLARQIEQTSRSAHDDSRSRLELTLLVVLGYSAVDADAGEVGEDRRDGGEVGVRLHGELARGSDDEDGDGAATFLGGREGEDVLDRRDSESDRLSGSARGRGLAGVGRRKERTYPVSAIPITSRPPIMTGKEALWMGVGLV